MINFNGKTRHAKIIISLERTNVRSKQNVIGHLSVFVGQ
jgi:hypothetical protein